MITANQRSTSLLSTRTGLPSRRIKRAEMAHVGRVRCEMVSLAGLARLVTNRCCSLALKRLHADVLPHEKRRFNVNWVSCDTYRLLVYLVKDDVSNAFNAQGCHLLRKNESARFWMLTEATLCHS